jgi:metal-responsive CopG/Arc/MetJ family transcriptional regulator
MWIILHIGIHTETQVAGMKTIQMTIDEPLLTKVDRTIAELQITRSAFIRAALEAALRRHDIQKLERQHAQGYAQQPATSDEFDAWADEQHWGAE